MGKLGKRVLVSALSAAMLFTSMPGGVAAAAEPGENSELTLITDYDMTLTPEGKLEDRAGDHDGVMISMGEADIQNGALTFTGNKAQYVELPAGTFGDDESFTVDLKFNTSQKAYAWVYNIGAGDITDYVFLNPMRAEGNTVFALKQQPDGEKYVSKDNVVVPGEDTWATMVFYDNQSADLYINGVKIGTTNHGYSVQTILENGRNGDCIGYLGKSLFPADPGYIGNISYFRVYDDSLSEEQVWRNYASQQGYSDEQKAQMDMEALSLEEGEIGESLTLPEEGRNGAAIQWSSSHPDILSETGTLTRGAEDTEVTLTASVTYGSVTKRKDFHFTVASNATVVARAKEELTIDNANPVVGNLTLKTELEGAHIAWISSNSRIITDKATANEDYADTPAGVVTRGDTDQEVTLTATISSGTVSDTKEFKLTVKKKAEKKEYAAYLYVHFNELIVGTSLQQIYFGVSKDGLQWTALNDNQPILESTVGDLGVRDPYIVRSPEGDKFYLIGTDLDIHHPKYDGDWGLMATIGSNCLVIWESTDLVNWTESRMVNVADSIGAGCAWAPAAIYDDVTGEYLVFWSSPLTRLTGDSGQGYIFVSKTRDFVTFTEPELYSDPQVNTIDADIYKRDDNSYYRLLKQQQEGYVYLQSSSKLLDYTDAPVYEIGGREFVARGMEFSKIENTAPGCVETFRGAYEGPTMFKFFDRDEWCILVDEYGSSAARGYIPFLTKDLDEPNSVKIAADNSYTMTDGAKHGSVIPITQEEYDALMAKWGVENEKYPEEQEKPVASYDFEEEQTDVMEDKSGDNDGQLFGNAQYRYDEEKESQVLYLDGSSGTYAQLPTGLMDGMDYLTVSMDIKAEGTDDYHFDFTVGQDTDRYLYLRVRDNEIRNAITARGNWKEKDATYRGGGLLGQWIHAAVVMENHKMSFYLNGEKVAETRGVGVRSISELGENLVSYLGKSFYDDPYFKGSYDDVKIYNRALSGAEIWNEAHDIVDKEEYTATYLAGEGGSIQGTAVQKVEEGERTETVTAVADEGYRFLGWSDGVTDAARSDVMTNDLTVTAEFEKTEEPQVKEFTVTYLAGEGGSIQGTVIQRVEEGQKTTEVTAVADEGYRFLKWSDGVETTARSDEPTSNLTVTAEFEKESSANPDGNQPANPDNNQPADTNGKPSSGNDSAQTDAQRIKLNKSRIQLGRKEKFKLTAKVSPENASQKVTYTSSNRSVATVSASGKITARKPGKAVITATASNGKKATCKVTVKKAPKKITLKAKTKTLKKGKSYKIKKVLPKNTASYKITYRSSKKSVATVSKTGKITAKKKGRAVITVKTYNGKKARLVIVVK